MKVEKARAACVWGCVGAPIPVSLLCVGCGWGGRALVGFCVKGKGANKASVNRNKNTAKTSSHIVFLVSLYLLATGHKATMESREGERRGIFYGKEGREGIGSLPPHTLSLPFWYTMPSNKRFRRVVCGCMVLFWVPYQYDSKSLRLGHVANQGVCSSSS